MISCWAKEIYFISSRISLNEEQIKKNQSNSDLTKQSYEFISV